MSEWTKGYALTQPFEAVYDHVNELQEDNADLRACNAELLAAIKKARALCEDTGSEGGDSAYEILLEATEFAEERGRT